MLPTLDDLRQRRQQLGLTQTKLAEISNVSQSLIAKIEAGRIVPSYANAGRIFGAIESLSEKAEVKAKDIMSDKVIAVQPNTIVRDAAKLIRKHAVSQMPVIKNDAVLGTISEKAILEKLQEDSDFDIRKMRVQQAMDAPMPIVHEGAGLSAITALLEHYPGVLVAREGKVIGIITKADLLSVVIGKRGK